MISAAAVKKLRERTGAGMMECKKALLEVGGDMELAIENLRKSGIAGLFAGSLELVKEGNLIIKQNKLFDDIYIKENNE